MFTQQLMNALAIGSVYALTAMGATLIYGILGILDIANAGAYLVGAYLGWYIYHATGNINGNYSIGCELQRKRIECAIMIKAALADNGG